jgi:trigger factor
MQVTETLSEGLKHEYKIVVPADEIETQVGAKLDELRENVQIKGFRPGKVPISLLKTRYQASVMGEVVEETVNRSSQQALLDQGVRPALQPEIKIDKFEDGTDLEYTMSIEALPEIEPADVKSLKLTRLKAGVEDEKIDESLTGLAEQQKNFADAEDGKAAEAGDAVRIDFVGRIDGEPFDGGSAEDHQLELGSGTFLPGFEDQLAGAKAGDKVEVKVSFPDEYPGEHVAGKDAVFDVDVKQVLIAEAVTVDDALAARLGMPDLAALRAAVTEQMQREYDNMTRLRLKRQILDHLADANEFEVPPSLAAREFESIWQQIEQDMEKAGETWDDSKMSEEEARADYGKIANRRVRLGLLLSDIGGKNEIVVPQEELNRAVMEQARRYPGQEQQVFDYFRENPQAMNELQAPLYEEKVIDFLIEMADVTEEVVPIEELMRDPEQAEAEAEAEEKPKKKPARKKAAKKKAEPKAKGKDE